MENFSKKYFDVPSEMGPNVPWVGVIFVSNYADFCLENKFALLSP